MIYGREKRGATSAFFLPNRGCVVIALLGCAITGAAIRAFG
jgi:hypothetical protein